MRPPKYCRHKGSGQACVWLNGKRIYLGVHGSEESKKRYKQIVADFLQNKIEPAPCRESGQITCRQLIVAFTNHIDLKYIKDGSPTSEPRAFRVALQTVMDLYEDLPALDFGPSRLKACRQRLVEADYVRDWVNSYTRRIIQCWKWGVSEELVPETTWRALTSVEALRRGQARDNEPIKPVPLRDVVATMKKLSPIVACMVRVQLRTGARPGEICNMRGEEIDRTGDIWRFTPGHHKTEHHGRFRIIAIGPKAQRALGEFIKDEGLIFNSHESRLWWINEKNPIRDGVQPKLFRKAPKAFTVGNYGQAIRRACAKARVPEWSPNQLRHTAATLIRKHFGLEKTKSVLSHSATSTTEIYAERSFQEAADIARVLG